MSFTMPIDGAGVWANCSQLTLPGVNLARDVANLQRGVALRLGVSVDNVGVSAVQCTDGDGTIVVYQPTRRLLELSPRLLAASDVSLGVQMTIGNVPGSSVASVQSMVRHDGCRK